MNRFPAQTQEKRAQQRMWRAWQRRNQLQEMQGAAMRTKLVKWASITVLLLTAALWSHVTDYGIFVRFAVAAGALWVAQQAIGQRAHVWAAVFIGLALLYNPIVPVFVLAGGTQLGLVLASVVFFAASLVLLKSSGEGSIRESLHIV
jgi:hypothetical protein